MKSNLIVFSLLVLFGFCSNYSVAQTDCCTEINRPEPGETYLDALSLCFLNDEIECFSMRPITGQYVVPGCPSHRIENPHTYILFPNEDTFQLRVQALSCNFNRGFQVMLYKLISTPFVDSCENLNPQLSFEQLFCDGTTGAVEFTQGNAKDEIFYLFIDGLVGDRCDYTIESLRGGYRNAPRDSVSLTGPTGLPPGYTATYIAEQFSFDCYRSYGCNCGICGLDTFGVRWTGPPGAIIDPIPGTLSANVTMGTQSGSLCIRIKDDCENLLQCIQIEVTNPEFYIKCPSEFAFAHGEIYGDAGIYYPIENNKIYEVIVEEFIEEIVINNIDACIGDEFLDCMFNTIAYPETDNICSITQNDTCKTVQTYITWHTSFDTTIYDTVCFGNSVFFCGAEIVTGGAKDCDAISIYGCDSNTHLILFILPPDTLFSSSTLCDGGDLLFCGGDIDQAGVFSCVDTTNDGCVQINILKVTLDAIDTIFIDTTLCSPADFIFHGVTYTSQGIYTVEEIDAGGCLDRFIIDLMYDEMDTTFVSDTVCLMQPYDFCGMSLTDPGVYYCTFEIASACDSVVELTLFDPPCLATTIYSVLCPGEELIYPDTTIKEDGVYIIANRFFGNCPCVDTFIVEYSNLGSSQVMASNELSCDTDSVDLSIQYDDVFFTFNKTEWYFENQLISDDAAVSVMEAGLYFVVIEYSHVFIETCMDTLFYELMASDAFAPTLNWVDRQLVLCDSTSNVYYLEFETDATRSVLTLLNTNEEWIDQSIISIDLLQGADVYNFRLTLQSENGDCEEIVAFDVKRLTLETDWPDTLYISDLRSITTLENPLFNLDPPAENIAYSPLDFINAVDNELLIINPTAAGRFNMSFGVGDCIYNYTTLVVRNLIYVPNAFSPNDDGINDQFMCFTSAGFQVEEMKIFNRWGLQVFSSTIQPIAWNGRSNDKDMPEGVYVVQYTYSDQAGNIFDGVSELLLLR